MDRVQRSGLITLTVLLLTAAGAHFIGKRPGSQATIPDRKVAQDPATFEGVQFLPPEQRERFVGAQDFVRPPVRHPLTGVGGRDILAGLHDPPEPSILGDLQLPSEKVGEQGVLLSLDGGSPAQQPTPQPASGRELPTGPGTGRDPFRAVRVRENDTLTKIASRELGDGNRWRQLAELNELREPYRVVVGQLLYLPDDGAQASNATARSDEPAGPQNASESTATPSEYTVKPGDTPGEISQAVYGTSRHWKHILQANGIASARELKAGARLKIPPRP